MARSRRLEGRAPPVMLRRCMALSPRSFGFTLLIAGLAAMPPLSIDMSLPAMGAIGATLGAPPSQAGLTLSLFMAGFALAQLGFGPLSDRFGRRASSLALLEAASPGRFGAAILCRARHGGGKVAARCCP